MARKRKTDWQAIGKFTVADLAKLSDRSPATIRGWCCVGRGDVRLMPDKQENGDATSKGRLLFTAESVEQFLKNNNDLRTNALNEAIVHLKPTGSGLGKTNTALFRSVMLGAKKADTVSDPKADEVTLPALDQESQFAAVSKENAYVYGLLKKQRAQLLQARAELDDELRTIDMKMREMTKIK